MENTTIVYNALKSNLSGKLSGTCKLCGCITENGFKAKDYIKDARFTNTDCCKAVSSDIICECCAFSMSETDLRRKSFFATSEKITFLAKNDIENYIFNLDKYISAGEEFIFCITRSFKKHNAFRARVNCNTHCFFIREEDDEYMFNADELKNIYSKLNEMYIYFSKDEISSADYIPLQIKKFGIDKFIEYENVIKKYRHTKQFDLMLHILNSEKRNEIVKSIKEKEKSECRKKKSENMQLTFLNSCGSV